MKIELERYLDDIEARLDDEQESRIQSEWFEWIHHKNISGPYRAAPRRPVPSRLEWPHVNINDAVKDDELGIYRELESVHHTLANGRSSILRMRPNYGVGNVATAFGCRSFEMDRATDTLPNVFALSESEVEALAHKPVPGLEDGNFADMMRFGRNLLKIREKYPRIAKYVRVEQPDLQGPVDNLELIMGSSPMFYAIYDDADGVHALLDKITSAMMLFLDKWIEMFPESRMYANYFTHVEAGMICIRDDSAMNLSPDMFSEFIMPYDGRLLEKYGGFVHFCGRGDHFIDRLVTMKGLSGVNMSQPHLNDMEKIYSCTIDQGIHLGITAQVDEVKGHDIRNLLILA